jgi:membrane fusion protein (multidrug efflux system)
MLRWKLPSIVLVSLLVPPTIQGAEAAQDADAALAAQAGERVATVRVPEEAGTINRELTGLVAAERQHGLAFEVDGRVVSPSLEMGTLIRQGDPIIVLDTRTAAANLNLARAGLAFASADLQLQQAQHERLAANHAKQLVADADLDIALAGLERARAAYLQAEARQTLMQVELQKHTIRAAFEGQLTARTPETGTYVRTGASLGELVNPKRRVRIEITSEELRGIESGQLQVHLRSLPGALEVLAASPLADARSGMHALALIIPPAMTGAPGELLPLKLMDTVSFKYLDRALRRDAQGEFLWIVEDGAVHRVDWPFPSDHPQRTGQLKGAVIVVMGGEALTEGSSVETVRLDELP